ncbi:MAG: aminotransferase class I/II-fold pyridoxal phosphate-dependent enzyme [Bowdeniella nasicola]|nr:aminotransferase class I/II-fold pyridoxal phosphate-dependent enzyme [Bowdeniella nasicola]
MSTAAQSPLIDLAFVSSAYETPEVVRAAVRRGAEQVSYPAGQVGEDYLEAAARWQRERHGWDVPADSALFVPRTTQALAALLNAGPVFHEPGGSSDATEGAPDPALALQMGAPMEVVGQLAAAEAAEREAAEPGPVRPPVVVALSPAYGRIAALVRASGAQLRLVRMENFGGRLRINWPALENAMIGADYLLWTNPHNPSGRVWSEEELKRVGYLAEIYRAVVVSDDIHADFTRPDVPYTPMAKACPYLFETGRLLLTSSPTITFSMAGLGAAVAFATGELRESLRAARDRMGLGAADALAVPAAVAAWREGGAFADELATRVADNCAAAVETLQAELPDAVLARPDGTALVWADLSAYAKDDDAVLAAAERAGVQVSPGGRFGETWNGWVRLACAQPKETVLEGISRLAGALR